MTHIGSQNLKDKFETWKFDYCCIGLLYRYAYGRDGNLISLRTEFKEYLPPIAFVSSKNQLKICKSISKKIKKLQKVTFSPEEMKYITEFYHPIGRFILNTFDSPDKGIEPINPLNSIVSFEDILNFNSQAIQIWEENNATLRRKKGTTPEFEPLKFECFKALSHFKHYDEIYRFLFEDKVEEQLCKILFDTDTFEPALHNRQRSLEKPTDWAHTLKRDCAKALCTKVKVRDNIFESPFDDENKLKAIVQENELEWTPEEFKFMHPKGIPPNSDFPERYSVRDEWFNERYKKRLFKVYSDLIG